MAVLILWSSWILIRDAVDILLEGTPAHINIVSLREELNRVSGVGFQILRVTSLVSLPLPLMVMSRLRGLCRRDTFDAMEELNVGKRLNAALLAVLDFERRLIQRGVAFRAGGSLLVVAGKPAT